MCQGDRKTVQWRSLAFLALAVTYVSVEYNCLISLHDVIMTVRIVLIDKHKRKTT